MSTENIQELLQAGIRAARQGNRSAARRLLHEVVAQAPNNELAWIWLASVAENIGERREYLERVLKINPNNERAAQALERLERSGGIARPPRPTSSPRRKRQEHATTAEREVLLTPPRRRRRRLAPTMMALLAILGILLITLGLLLLWNETRSDDADQTATPLGAAAMGPTATRTPRADNPTPDSGTARPTRPPQSPPPTWTPTATWTPSPTTTTTETPPPLDTYTLLISKQPANQSPELFTLPGSGTREERLVITLSEADRNAGLQLLGMFDAAYSPDGTQIAFAGHIRTTPAADAVFDLFVVPAEGGVAQRLTTQEANNMHGATWSPDGQRLAFASDADGDFDIYVVPATGGPPVAITTHSGEDREPAWSPTGDTIAFATDLAGPGELEIFSMTAQGDNLQRLTNNMNHSYAPAWSPDGQQIVFVSDRRGNNDLYIMNADGSGERAIRARDVAADELDPAWSPDGRWIAFSSNREGTVFDLYLIRPDGSTIERLTVGDNAIDTRYPDWKPQ